jgi:hypothetical protein
VILGCKSSPTFLAISPWTQVLRLSEKFTEICSS